MQPLYSTTPYRPVRALASAVVPLLAANILTRALTALSSAAQIASGAAASAGADESELTALDLFSAAAGLLYLIVFIPTVVLFCVWLYRAYRNLAALGNPKPALQHSPGWAVGSFFVPIANLFIPYRAVRETWAKSDPAAPDETYVAPVAPSAPAAMNLWWGFWVAANIVDNAAFRLTLNAKSPSARAAAEWVGAAGDVLAIVAAGLAIAVVREISRRQEERSRRVVYRASAPPPPPLFTQPPAAGER